MKNKKQELNVDFIGSQNNKLTKQEEAAISEYLKSQKNNHKKPVSKSALKKEKVLV
ncbi:MAG: hypothetical protein KGL19_07090 [Bacteroidota bacterium]|nr:hypothetical protein [Bacteroidota bacterium]